jgi:MYXO-CTERM domain-containing protein
MQVPTPGGAAREVALSSTSSWPPFSSLMPWAEKIEQVPLLGDLMTVADNADSINAELLRWNATRGWPPPAGSPSCVSTGSAGSSFGYGGAAGSLSTGGSTGLTPGGGANGCGCSLPGDRRGLGLAGVLGLVGLGWLRRRRS